MELNGGKMVEELEKQIRDLQKDLAEVQRQQTVLRLLPCMGDSEIRDFGQCFNRSYFLRKML